MTGVQTCALPISALVIELDHNALFHALRKEAFHSSILDLEIDGKATFPNMPVVPYNGMVWCPETEYGSFIARRNGKVYLTGNTYRDEMQCTALMQLSQVGLQFDENKSNNPFAYYSSVLGNAFTRVLNLEKKNQSLRDDILEQAGLMPSFTRQEKWHQPQDDATALTISEMSKTKKIRL